MINLYSVHKKYITRG